MEQAWIGFHVVCKNYRQIFDRGAILRRPASLQSKSLIMFLYILLKHKAKNMISILSFFDAHFQQDIQKVSDNFVSISFQL